MDEKNDKKKESIDDILSDLNGLLNRMPSILDGIKMPPLEPVEFENPVQEPEAEPQVLEPIAPAAEQKIESVSPETNPEPEKQVPQNPAQSDILYSPAEKKPEKLAPQSWPAPEAHDRPESQSFGDYMFSGGHEKQNLALKSRSDNLDSEKKRIGLPTPVNLAALPEQKTAKDEISGSAPLTAAPLFGDAGARDIKGELFALPGTSGDAEAGDQTVLHAETGFAELSCEALLPPAENEKALPVSQSGDSLLSGAPTQGAGREAGPDHTKPRSYESTADFGIPDIDALVKISQGEMTETPAPSAAEPPASDARQTALPGSAPLNPVSSGAENLEQELEKLTISDEIQTAAGGGEIVADTEAAPVGGLALEQPGAVFFKENSPEGDKTPAAAPAFEGAEQTPAGVGEPAAVPVSETEAAPADGLALEQPGAAFFKENSPEGDKTLVIAPSADGAGDEHTVMYQSGMDTPSVRPGADLDVLLQRQPPEGVTEERVRSLAFLYPEGGEQFCAEVLSELDAICLKSPSKPMFVRRAFVKVFELNTNPNFMFQTVSDAKAAGLIFAGTLPQDKVYELESVFSSSGSLFRHLTADSFNHSSALDLVCELILR